MLEILDKSFLQNKKILIVDDNKINQIVTKKILEQYGMKCAMAFDGNTAIELARNTDLDLILMDINMPGKNGFETTSEIRKFNENIPIIALTAMEMESIILKIKNIGMNDVIVKPYEKEIFLRTLLAHIPSLVED